MGRTPPFVSPAFGLLLDLTLALTPSLLLRRGGLDLASLL